MTEKDKELMEMANNIEKQEKSSQKVLDMAFLNKKINLNVVENGNPTT